jgi:hypothetical protein
MTYIAGHYYDDDRVPPVRDILPDAEHAELERDESRYLWARGVR